jgi:predicted GNAT superfamily acetyltransferase
MIPDGSSTLPAEQAEWGLEPAASAEPTAKSRQAEAAGAPEAQPTGLDHAPAGFVFRDLTSYDDFLACMHLQEVTWGEGFDERVPTAILRIAASHGGVLMGAFPEGQPHVPAAMVAFVFGLTGLQDGTLVHWSDMLAVRAEYRHRGLGVRLKWAQRDRLLSLGVEQMQWSFDPLEAVNARLNLNTLGARGVRYIESMYGDSTSVLHQGIGTDRLIVSWDLRASVEPRPAGARPVWDPASNAPVLRVPIPANLQALRALDPARALEWRLSSRALLAPHLEAGWQVVHLEGMPMASGDDPCLILVPPPRA